MSPALKQLLHSSFQLFNAIFNMQEKNKNEKRLKKHFGPSLTFKKCQKGGEKGILIENKKQMKKKGEKYGKHQHL